MYLEQAYIALVIGSICISIIFSFCFFFVKVPKKESLRNYRTSRKAMAFAYLVVGILNAIELCYISEHPSKTFALLVTLIVAAYQAILFTFTLLALINFEVVTKWKVYRELIPVTAFSISVYLAYFFDPERLFWPIYYTFTSYFVVLLVKYSITFFKYYGQYQRKIDNFFSAQEANRLRWVRTAYFAALLTGIIALLSLYLNNTFAVIFNIFYVVFFTYFGIRFLNYVYNFLEIEEAIVSVEKTPKEVREPSFTFSQLEQAIHEWEKRKNYTVPGITIEQVASEIKTNRTYLSSFINTYRKMTFNEWINHLRIEEAKMLMLEHPDMPVSQVGVMIGLSDKSNFGRQFLKRTGDTPLAWKSKNF